MLANKSDAWLLEFQSVDLIECHKIAYSRLRLLKGAVLSPFIESSLSLAASLLVLSDKVSQAVYWRRSKHLTCSFRAIPTTECQHSSTTYSCIYFATIR